MMTRQSSPTNLPSSAALGTIMAMDPAARPRVLIADEDAGTRLHVQQILSGAYEVHAVGDGETALASAREHAPDLVLADTIMPRLDGIGLLRALRDSPATRDIPVILLADRANEGSRLDALKAGAADYLLKPLSAPDLLVRVDARLEIARLRRQLSELERKSATPTVEDADAEFARKNNRLRRARNSLQRELSSRTEELFQLNRELLADRQRLLSLKDELSGELKAMNQLHELSARLLDHTGIERLLEQVLEASMAMLNADFGNVQLYDPGSRALKIVAQRGFKQDFLDYFDNVPEGTACCGAALEGRECIIVEDVLTDPVFAQHLPIVNAAGYRAVMSKPLIGRGGELLGIISTHFRQPHRPSESELRLVDLYARQAADMIEHKRAEDACRASEERFRRYFELGLIGMATTSPTKGILEANDELCRILGYERSELLQKTWAEMTHPHDLAADLTQFNRVIAGEIDGYSLDKRWVRKDGAIIDSIMSARCMRRADGSVEYFVGLVLDTTERRSAAEKFRRSEAYLAEAQRLSHTASWAWNVSTGEIYWSAELFRIYGLNPEKAKPSYPAVLNCIHPEDRSRVQRTFADAVRDQREYELAYRVVWSDGTVRHVNNLAHPVFNEAGDLVEYVGTTIDTTERVQTEEKLRRSEANLAEGQRISHTGSWAWNASSGEIFSSQELLRIFGLETGPSTLTHEIFLALIHPEDRQRIDQAFGEATHNRTDYDADYRIVHPDGSIRHVHNLAHPVFDESGALIEYVGTAVDLTERKHAAELVRKADEQVDMILESISDNFFGLSSDGRFTYFNKHAAKQMEVLGKEPAHLIGKVAWEEFPDMPNKENLQRVLTERVPITDELYYGPLGEWVENHMYPSHDGGLVTFQRYVTARKRMEEDLRKAQAELAHVTRVTTMGELAASIAHEINQPLGAIVNNGNVAIRITTAENASPLDKLADVVSDILADSTRISAIIARIRAAMKNSAPEKTSLQLKDVVADVLLFAESELANRRVQVRTELPEDLPRVSADRIQLQQVLLNLIMNGIEAMSDMEEARRILTIGGQRDDLAGQPAVLLAVRDFGNGFSPEDNERLFDAFYTTKPEGMGMGLRISRSIIEAHGGRLWAASHEGEGATFYCALPIAN